jgi:hypothetical protein
MEESGSEPADVQSFVTVQNQHLSAGHVMLDLTISEMATTTTVQ